MKHQLTLEELIFLLSRIEPNKTVQFDFGGFFPDRFMSYRGYYNQLALGFKESGEIAVSALLKCSEDALGCTYPGYKGGNYTMYGDTRVWAANYGSCTGTAIIGVIDTYVAVLETAFLE